MAVLVKDIDGGPPLRLVGGKKGKSLVNKEVTFDNSYATGGESLTPALLGLATIDYLKANPSATGYVFNYDYAANKILALRGAGTGAVLAEETAAVDLSATVTRVQAIGDPL